MIDLVDVYGNPYAVAVLYALLQERPQEANISHKVMPTFGEHSDFVHSRPYQMWYIVRDGEKDVGSVYFTRRREVGIFIFHGHQGKGYGTAAIAELRRRHPGRMLANVAPTNDRSAKFFEGLGAKLIQNTYEL